jgi:hypothetical protein
VSLSVVLGGPLGDDPRDGLRAPPPVLGVGPGHAGAAPHTPGVSFDILEQVWWRLDMALDLDMLEWSAKLGALEALSRGARRSSTTTSRPTAIEGSLSVIADACAEVGVRVSCAYGVTDRHGARRAPGAGGLEENERFLREGGRGMVGVHAAFTCDRRDDGRRRRPGRGPRRRRAHPRGRGPRRRRRGAELARRAGDDAGC